MAVRMTIMKKTKMKTACHRQQQKQEQHKQTIATTGTTMQNKKLDSVIDQEALIFCCEVDLACHLHHPNKLSTSGINFRSTHYYEFNGNHFNQLGPPCDHCLSWQGLLVSMVLQLPLHLQHAKWLFKCQAAAWTATI